MREAIRRLRDDGLLDARRGSGTYVVRRELDAPVLGSAGLARALAAAGVVERSDVLRFEEGPADAAVSSALGLQPGAVVVWCSRLRYADGEPLALEWSAIALPAGGRAALLGADLAHGSLYEALESRCSTRITAGREQLRAVTLGADERRLLRPSRGEGVLEVLRVAYAGEVAVEWRRSLVRGGGYVLGATWGHLPAAGLEAQVEGKPVAEGSFAPHAEGAVAMATSASAAQESRDVGPNQKS